MGEAESRKVQLGKDVREEWDRRVHLLRGLGVEGERGRQFACLRGHFKGFTLYRNEMNDEMG